MAGICFFTLRPPANTICPFESKPEKKRPAVKSW
jgi:hypothetical protein